jgi:hypothetical protein
MNPSSTGGDESGHPHAIPLASEAAESSDVEDAVLEGAVEVRIDRSREKDDEVGGRDTR